MLRRIYYLEDDEKIGYVTKKSLETINDYCPVEVEVFTNEKEFKIGLTENKPNLIIIDLMLGNTNGIDVLKELKANQSYKHIPVIIVSAKIADYERVVCLDAGAMAYFTKPYFTLRELNSSVMNFLEIPRDGTIVVCGDISLDGGSRIAIKNGKELPLSYKEFDLLKYFAKNNFKRITKEDIVANVWQNKIDEKSRTLDMHVKFLRQKVFADNPNVITTLPKYGYLFEYDPK